jgi:hypothetical protein
LKEKECSGLYLRASRQFPQLSALLFGEWLVEREEFVVLVLAHVRLLLPHPVPVCGDPFGALRGWLGQGQVNGVDRLPMLAAHAVRD